MADIIEINDLNAKELDIYARMSEGQLLNRANPENGIFIAESPKVIHRALDGGCKPVSILVEDKHIQTQAKDIIERCGNIPVYTASFDILTNITGYKLTRGMLCAMKRPPIPALDSVCLNAKRIAVLENVMNPTNLGAIFRSAAALNMDAVILMGNCTNPLYRRAIRVSMGTVFQVPWTYMDGDINTIRQLGFKTAAMALRDNCCNIKDNNIKENNKLAIVLGTEGEGLTDGTIDNCDYVVKIPMAHGVDSLNVAAASAIAFWELAI